MTFVVYPDLLFAVNFAMDLFIFLLLRLAGSKRAGVLRTAAGALVSAALASVFAVAAPSGGALSASASALILSAGVAAAFCPLPVKDFAKLMGLGYLLAFMTGGCAYGFAAGGGFPAFSVICAMGVTFAAAKIAVKAYREKAVSKRMRCWVNITLLGRKATLHGIIDTGNGLKEPFNGLPVIVADYAALKNALPEAVAALYESGEARDMAKLAEAADEGGLKTRARLIPYGAVGTSGGVMFGFNPDSVRVRLENGDEKSARAVVAISGERLGGFGAVVNPAIITG
jgi:stage II sporulation protein GA (sporulation sigma-E factor processing peptidase)